MWVLLCGSHFESPAMVIDIINQPIRARLERVGESDAAACDISILVRCVRRAWRCSRSARSFVRSFRSFRPVSLVQSTLRGGLSYDRREYCAICSTLRYPSQRGGRVREQVGQAGVL